jgi:hypothetical protein
LFSFEVALQNIIKFGEGTTSALLRVLPKDATNRYQESRRVEITTFWIADDGENCRNNSWKNDDNHMPPKDTWKTRSCTPKGGSS